ncbi:MAG: hypothetical protein KME29_08920 [Calothrix sp. FI2-JRJ7]|jgi:hypothetical protein|nr:hypothetical protein [Calothrix sp. FI2-JRJ7]
MEQDRLAVNFLTEFKQKFTEFEKELLLLILIGRSQYKIAGTFNMSAKVLLKPVKVVETPRDQWIKTMRNIGFSNEAAKLCTIDC